MLTLTITHQQQVPCPYPLLILAHLSLSPSILLIPRPISYIEHAQHYSNCILPFVALRFRSRDFQVPFPFPSSFPLFPFLSPVFLNPTPLNNIVSTAIIKVV